MQDYDIRNDCNEKWRQRALTFETGDVFVGKDQELDHLLSLVVDDEAHRIISLWGMGGVGKTTIARKLYNHHRTKNFFESFAWVCVSQECQIGSILEDVLKQLKKSPHQNSSDSTDTELLGHLCEIQRANKCMVVIDDIRKTEHWDGLNHALNFEGTKTKILLTTRKQNIANIGFAIKIGLFSDNEGREFLERKALPYINSQGKVNHLFLYRSMFFIHIVEY